MRNILAGGAVVMRSGPRGVEVLLVHRPRYTDWSVPKGKVDPGETVPAAAVREVWEETRVRIRLGTPLDTRRYDVDGRPKRVFYWTATALESVKRAPDREVDVVSWLPVKSALHRLTHEADRQLVRQALEQPTTTPLVIVRHGKAMDRKDWSRPDPARPISARGRREAVGLIPILEAYGVQELASSSSARCVSTLLPYAQRHELTIERHDKLSEEQGTAHPGRVRKLIRKIADHVSAKEVPGAVCGHRPVLPEMLAALDIAPRSMAPGESLVAHLDEHGDLHALERYRPQG